MTAFDHNTHALIPSDLINAIQSFDGFANVHLTYWTRYGGQLGLCTYQDAFEYLTDDLREYGLPVKYSSFQSFKSMKTRSR